MPNNRLVVRHLCDIEAIPTSHKIGLKSVLLSNDETISAVTQIAITRLCPSEKSEIHIHPTMDEHFLFESGEGILTIDGIDIKTEKGMFVLVPAGAAHSIQAISQMSFLTIGVAI